MGRAGQGRAGVRDGLFRVALGFQPSQFTASLHPFINVSLACKASNIANFLARAVGFDLPVAFDDPLGLKSDARGFAHTVNMPRFAPRRQGRLDYPGQSGERSRELLGRPQFVTRTPRYANYAS